MSELALLVAELENGSTDLASCLSTRPDLSHEDQFQLVLADQKYRVRRSEPCSLDHYLRILPWLASDPARQQRLIQNEFSLRQASESGDALLDQFATLYSGFGPPLVDKLHALLHDQTPHCDSDEEHDTFGTRPPSQSAARAVPVDLTGSFVSSQTIGDLREGRYRFARKLGQGNFGAVYLAQDTELKRQVAVKVPSRDALAKLVDVDSYLVEAQTVAALDHPHIVTVYDVGRTLDGSVFVVSKFIDGCSLADWMKKSSVDFEGIVKLLEKIAEALHHAHQRRLIHRDIKPANILIEESTGTPYVADFGLAIREEDYLLDSRIAGTPAFMSPEQARGEGHRLDGRSDLFSLGVVMYQMLTGRLPFLGQSFREIADKITSEEPKAPRSIKSDIPAELERICLKLLRKRASDRYANGRELAEDLRAWLTPSTRLRAKTRPTKITPRGLRSFTSEDAGFFLDLLPGPHNREGLPESISFWKEKIEQRDPDQTFTVGLLYGPSGCGKSSLVKAGLLPNLSSEVIPIYLEATPKETEQRMLRELRKAFPEFPQPLGLVDAIKHLRRGEFKKVIFIIDQFEQWLYGHSHFENAELTIALRQCDGKQVQAVVMVREDFWISVSRFLATLDIPILERENSAMVDLFSMEHAAKVLGLLGIAYGKLPASAEKSSAEKNSAEEWNEDQKKFIQQAVQGLSQEGKVISVRLAVLADMMKQRDWTTAALNEVGGIEGVGVTFLEEMFGSRHAPIQHRQHQEAVRGLLSALLPAIGTDIKGSMQSAASLQAAAGYEQKPSGFQSLIEILDKNLRLITPVDDTQTTDGGNRQSYQLAHDYLVSSLREWLTRKQRETPKGRAEIKLAERAAAWSLNKESKQLPTLVEWFQIGRWTERSKWLPNEREVMRQATRHHVQRLSLAATMIAFLVLGGWFVWRETARQQDETRIAGLVNALATAEPSQISEIIKQLDRDPEVAASYLAPLLAADVTSPEVRQARLHAILASVSRDPKLVEPIEEVLLTGKVNYILPIRQILSASNANLSESFAKILRDTSADPQRRFRAALAIAAFASSDDSTWTETIRTFVAQQLVASNAEYQPILREALRPIQDKLLGDLERIFGDSAASEAQRLSAANAMADYAANDRQRLTQLLTQATPEQYAVIYPLVSVVPSPETIAQLSEVVATPPPEELGSVARIAYGQQRANAAVTMLKLGEKEKVLPVFEWTDDPEAMTQFIFRCKPRGITIDTLLDLLEITTRRVSEGSSASEGSDTDASAPTSSTSLAHASGWERARYAIMLAIGEYAPTDIPPSRRDALVKQLADWYANDPNSGVHGASGWLLRYLGENEIATRIDQTPVPYSPDREWFTLAITVKPTPSPKPKPEEKEVGSEPAEKKEEKSDTTETEPSDPETPPEPLPPKTFYYTFIVHPKGEYTIGSVEDETDSLIDEVRHAVILTRPFALLDREITFEELIAFNPEYAGFMHKFGGRPTDSGYGPHWYDSISFCRWLGKEMGLPEANQCYPDPEMLDKEQYPREPVPEANWAPRDWPLDLSKRGFRLPTESEWEIAARSGSRTVYGFGSDVGLLDRFGWFTENSGKKVHPGREKRPNVRGLFDMHGNLFEWTHDWKGDFGSSTPTDPLGAKNGSARVNRGGSWDYRPEFCRTARRSSGNPTRRGTDNGFRPSFVPSVLSGSTAAPRSQ